MTKKLMAAALFGGVMTAMAQATKLPELVVKQSLLSEEAAVGPYEQPEWTLARRFPTTRVYLQKMPYEIGVEQWVRSKFYKGDQGKHRLQEEVEIGLPHRIQLDIYDNWEISNKGTLYHDNTAGEIRYALADWGKIPMNPTVYAEFKFKDEGPNVAEYKLLLGDELGQGWHWGANAAYEYELGGENAKEYAGALAISKTIADSKFSLGLEALYTSESIQDERSSPEKALNIGPSAQWRPTKNTHLDVSILPGFNDEAPDILSFLVFGYDFGNGEAGHKAAPSSLKSN